MLMGTNQGTPRDSAAIGGIISVWFLGFGIGALMAGSYSDNIGRLRTATVGIYFAILGAALQASAMNITWMMFGRIIGGIGVGHLNTIIPVWSSEVADARLRGAFIATQLTLAMTASGVVFWMEYGLYIHANPVVAWRLPLGFQIVFLVIALATIPFAPESARYLASIGQYDEARRILEHCRMDNSPELIDQEMLDIRQAILLEAEADQVGWIGTLFGKQGKLHPRRRMLLGAGVQVMQKLTGIDFISVYAPNMFALSGYSTNMSDLLAGGNFGGYVLALSMSIYLLDRVGRRKMMLVGCAAMGIVLFVGGGLAYKVYTVEPSQVAPYGAGVATVLYLYTAIYGGTWLGTCWCYPSEIHSIQSRSKGAALATLGFSVAGGIINIIIPYLINAVHYWIFFIFGIVNFLMLIPVQLFYVETKMRSLEELDYIFSSSSPLQWVAEKEFVAKNEQRIAERAKLGTAV